ncbi:MAG: WhiB family transcriptional regulator [Motilibacteraceae bacterium]
MKGAPAVVTAVGGISGGSISGAIPSGAPGGPSTAAGRSRTSGTGSEPAGRPSERRAPEPRSSAHTTVPREPLRPLVEDWAWQEEAACRGADPRLFFPKDDERGTARRTRQQAAAAFCNRCEVRRSCLEHALRSGERYGVWGGYEQGRLREMLGEGGGSRATA